jgi:hypothetical protein
MRAALGFVIGALLMVVGLVAILSGAVLAGGLVIWGVIAALSLGFDFEFGLGFAPDALGLFAAGLGLMAGGMVAIFGGPRIRTWITRLR